jgi:hypothetical protein
MRGRAGKRAWSDEQQTKPPRVPEITPEEKNTRWGKMPGTRVAPLEQSGRGGVLGTCCTSGPEVSFP